VYASPNVRVRKSRRMKWADRVVRMGEIRKVYKVFWSKNIKGIDGKIILEWILGKYTGSCGLDSSGSG
jgi:hypothetical protein